MLKAFLHRCEYFFASQRDFILFSNGFKPDDMKTIKALFLMISRPNIQHSFLYIDRKINIKQRMKKEIREWNSNHFFVVWFCNIDNLEVDFGLKIGALEVDLVCILMWNKIPGWNYKKNDDLAKLKTAKEHLINSGRPLKYNTNQCTIIRMKLHLTK